MNQDFSEEIIIERQGGLGVITLNRPKALNSLSFEMIRQISSALQIWAGDAGVKCVLFRGAGDRAFCAGGDLKIFHKAGMELRRGNALPRVAALFFAEEYSLNKQIFHYPKPTIAFMNGITMGGGYGIGGNCKHRIATERTVFAMPETGIGFFPDVGSMYYLTRVPGNAGRYLSLSAVHIGPGDMIRAGLADYYIPSENEGALMKALQVGHPVQVIESRAAPAPEGRDLATQAARIESIFAHEKIMDIRGALEKDNSDWARATLEILSKRSPASLKVTAAHYAGAAHRTFDEIIETDFILAQRFLERMDLYEGVRALLIDRDNTPKWEPPSLEAVTDEYVQRYFEPTGHTLSDVRIFAA